jgi:hypothetical protein
MKLSTVNELDFFLAQYKFGKFLKLLFDVNMLILQLKKNLKVAGLLFDEKQFKIRPENGPFFWEFLKNLHNAKNA